MAPEVVRPMWRIQEEGQVLGAGVSAVRQLSDKIDDRNSGGALETGIQMLPNVSFLGAAAYAKVRACKATETNAR